MTQSTVMAPDEFTRLQAEVAPRLWAWAALHLGPELRTTVDPEDVLQEVTCRAWRRVTQFDPREGPFAAWAFGIARNVLGELLGQLARGTGIRHAWSTSSWAQVPDDATRATARVAKSDHLAALVAWADGLDEPDRHLVLYKGLEGWSDARVGEMLGLSSNAVQKRWTNLRARLQHEPRLLALLAPDQRA